MDAQASAEQNVTFRAPSREELEKLFDEKYGKDRGERKPSQVDGIAESLNVKNALEIALEDGNCCQRRCLKHVAASQEMLGQVRAVRSDLDEIFNESGRHCWRLVLRTMLLRTAADNPHRCQTFTWPGIDAEFCGNAWCAMTGCSREVRVKMVEDIRQSKFSVVDHYHRPKGMRKMVMDKAGRASVIYFLENLGRTEGVSLIPGQVPRAIGTDRAYLPGRFTTRLIYRMYRRWIASRGDIKPPSMSAFFSMWREHVPNLIRISVGRKECNIAANIEVALAGVRNRITQFADGMRAFARATGDGRSVDDSDELFEMPHIDRGAAGIVEEHSTFRALVQEADELRAKLFEHLQWAYTARAVYTEAVTSAKVAHEQILRGHGSSGGSRAQYSVAFQSPLPLPHRARKNRRGYIAFHVGARLLGIHDDASGLQSNFVYNEADGEEDEDALTSLMFQFLAELSQDDAPQSVALYFDRPLEKTSPLSLFCLCAWLTTANAFEHIELHFLYPGIVFGEVDSGLSAIRSQYENETLYSVEDVADMIDRMDQHRARVAEAKGMRAWSSAFDPVFRKVLPLPRGRTVADIRSAVFDASRPGVLFYRFFPATRDDLASFTQDSWSSVPLHKRNTAFPPQNFDIDWWSHATTESPRPGISARRTADLWRHYADLADMTNEQRAELFGPRPGRRSGPESGLAEDSASKKRRAEKRSV